MTNSKQLNNNRVAVNNATLDPIQGFHLNVYMNDMASGIPVMVGGFTSFQKTMRNATEAYMPFGRKTPRLLDGEFQYGWVLERGLLDIRLLEDCFGFERVGAEFKADPTPRFVITVEMNAPELEKQGVYFDPPGGNTGSVKQPSSSADQRVAKGKYQLLFAKIDSVTLGAMAGRNVVAVRLEGLCESIRFTPGGTLLNTNRGTVTDRNSGTLAGFTNSGAQPVTAGTGSNYLFS